MNLTINEAIGKLSNRRSNNAVENLALFGGDHLNLGTQASYKGYIGLLPPATDKSYGFITEWLERIFAAANLVKSAVIRNVDGVLSREPDWNLVFPNEISEKARAEITTETDEAVNFWWNETDALKTLFRAAAIKVLLEDEIYIRPIIKYAPRDENGNILVQDSLSSALDFIDFEIVAADKCGIFRDEETGRKFSICHIQTGAAKEVELSWIGADGLTYLRILTDNDLKQWAAAKNLAQIAAYINQQPNKPTDRLRGFDLGGKLFLHRVTRDGLITEPARSLQRSVNYALTTMNKNLNIAGSRETGYGNAQRPKTRIVTKDAAGNIISSVEEDAPLVKGASNANFFVGLPVYDPAKLDASGNPIIVDYKQPVQFIVDPVAVDTFIKAFETLRELFLEEVGQTHILGANLSVSGKSRQESRADFEKTLKATKVSIDPLGRYVLDVALKLAAAFCNRKEFSALRFNFDCIITPGAVDADELKHEADDVDAGRSTLYFYLVKKGIEDPDAIIQQLKSADDYLLTQINKAVDLWIKASGKLSLEKTIDILPITEDDKATLVSLIVKSDQPPVKE